MEILPKSCVKVTSVKHIYYGQVLFYVKKYNERGGIWAEYVSELDNLRHRVILLPGEYRYVV